MALFVLAVLVTSAKASVKDAEANLSGNTVSDKKARNKRTCTVPIQYLVVGNRLKYVGIVLPI